MKPKLMIFCKAPIVGQVKTRLIPFVGGQAACELHVRLATRLINDCLGSEIRNKADVELWCSPDTSHEFYQQFDLPKMQQVGDDLGEKMSNAFISSDRPSILIGTDCPNLSVDYLVAAIDKLENHDALLGPAEDGGYGLIALQKPNPNVFKNIKWSTSSVCADTCKILNTTYKNWGLLSLLWDVDREEDLIRYKALQHDI